MRFDRFAVHNMVFLSVFYHMLVAKLAMDLLPLYLTIYALQVEYNISMMQYF
jgi:hypothetical protein